jgi:uncharacterized repeat protein (TIGR03806 family)
MRLESLAIGFLVFLSISSFGDSSKFTPPATLPDKLSSLGLFTDLSALTPIPELLPYQVNFPLWSDGAAKKRWIYIPKGKQIKFDSTEEWQPPVGTILVKEFDFDHKSEIRIEYLSDSGWQLSSYVWQADQLDATRVTQTTGIEVSSSASPKPFKWFIPSPNECLKCHKTGASVTGSPVLGLKTEQLGPMQLSQWIENGLFSNPPPTVSNLSYLPDLSHDTTSTPVHDLARGYLAVNCSSCHRPNGFVPTNLDMRWEIGNTDMNAIGKPPMFGNLGVQGAMIITPSDKSKSILWLRMSQTGPDHMPFLGSKELDQTGLRYIQQWIDSGAP